MQVWGEGMGLHTVYTAFHAQAQYYLLLSSTGLFSDTHRDRVLKIHKGFESSSADSYFYPQKSRAVRSGSVPDVFIITKSRTLPQCYCTRVCSNEVTLHHAQIRHSGSAPDSRVRYGQPQNRPGKLKKFQNFCGASQVCVLVLR